MSELDDIRARRDAVTPGVWSASWAWGKSGEVYNAWAEAPFTSGTCLEDVAPQAEADATFIAAAPADIDTLLAMVDALTGERDEAQVLHRLVCAKFDEAVRERDALALELSHLRPEWRTVCAERDALRAQADRYGADQWRRGNAGQEPQEFSEWQRKVQP